jgi:hypothetical protein
MKKIALITLFLLPMSVFADDVTSFTLNNTADGTDFGVNCYAWGTPMSYTLTYTGTAPDFIIYDFDNLSPYDGSSGFIPGVSSNGHINVSPSGGTYTSTFNWSDVTSDPLPHANPDHIWQSRVHQNSSYLTRGTQAFIVEDTCSGGGGGGTGSTTPLTIYSNATTTDQILRTIGFGEGIIMFFFFLGFVGYIWNAISSKRKKSWQK